MTHGHWSFLHASAVADGSPAITGFRFGFLGLYSKTSASRPTAKNTQMLKLTLREVTKF